MIYIVGLHPALAGKICEEYIETVTAVRNLVESGVLEDMFENCENRISIESLCGPDWREGIEEEV